MPTHSSASKSEDRMNRPRQENEQNPEQGYEHRWSCRQWGQYWPRCCNPEPVNCRFCCRSSRTHAYHLCPYCPFCCPFSFPLQDNQVIAIHGSCLWLHAIGTQISAIAVTGGSSLSLADLVLPLAALATTLAGLAEADSRLFLAAVTVPQQPDWGTLTGTVRIAEEGERVGHEPGFCFRTFVHLLSSSSQPVHGRFRGRAPLRRWLGGYLPNEDCEITVDGAEDTLRPCPTGTSTAVATARPGRSWKPARP